MNGARNPSHPTAESAFGYQLIGCQHFQSYAVLAASFAMGERFEGLFLMGPLKEIQNEPGNRVITERSGFTKVG